MNKEKKSTLEELMGNEEREAVLADDKADAISLDEPKKKTWLIVLLSVIGLLLLAAGGYVAYQSYMADKTLKAEEKIENPIVEEKTEETPVIEKKSIYTNASEGLNLRKEPSSDSEVLAIIPNGTKFVILETSGDWYKVEYDSKIGWIAKLYTSETDPLVYKDTIYGYQITFPATWAYKLFPSQAEEGETAGYYVAVPTADTAIDEIPTGVDKGYASLFAISIYTPSQWESVGAESGIKPDIAAQNANYIIAYSKPNGVQPTDLSARIAEVASVIATIKFY